MRTLTASIEDLDDETRQELADCVAAIREPADWNPVEQGSWHKQENTLASLFQFIRTLARDGGLTWEGCTHAGVDVHFDADSDGIMDPEGFTLTVLVEGIVLGRYITHPYDLLAPGTPGTVEAYAQQVVTAANQILADAARALH
ncbi:hypothetical protein [Dietzia sp. 179-F 9C3 NHS]|uniref:hypothetical protein n=1 Tax=Dietzia sp. 179-F 9C3 NHS TaxID=3374295 RepID=UPI00387A462B